ncbi:hypothetical protein [Ktedonobacter sp. SOSP1-52]|uniref:hypothetical protein n=1 Tax=Ktedonobacter sp. SOSP1-52 TaxID=2778366 RepID=UPI0019168668|nr:hypothetical protein [Ktedonobacter sp. SOSP1-52]
MGEPPLTPWIVDISTQRKSGEAGKMIVIWARDEADAREQVAIRVQLHPHLPIHRFVNCTEMFPDLARTLPCPATYQRHPTQEEHEALERLKRLDNPTSKGKAREAGIRRACQWFEQHGMKAIFHQDIRQWIVL